MHLIFARCVRSILQNMAACPPQLGSAFHGFALVKLERICPCWLSTASPALSELRFNLLTATAADPWAPGRNRDRPGQRAERKPFVGIVDIKLRPSFHHRQIAQGAGQILITQLALNAGG
jgi:hypothetical protein